MSNDFVHSAAPSGDVPSALTVDAQSGNAPSDEGSAKCARCGGTGVVDDGEIDCYPNGEPFSCGPIKCVKDCPACKPLVSLGLVERLRNGGQTDLADMAYGLVVALRDVLGWVPAGTWHTDAPRQSVQRARAALARATGARS